jgi:hypothetical protein
MQRVNVCGGLGQESTLVDTTLRYWSTVRILADLLWCLEDDLPERLQFQGLQHYRLARS